MGEVVPESELERRRWEREELERIRAWAAERCLTLDVRDAGWVLTFTDPKLNDGFTMEGE